MTNRRNSFVGLDLDGIKPRCLVAEGIGAKLSYLSCGPVPLAQKAYGTGHYAPPMLDVMLEAERSNKLTIISAVVGIGGVQVRSNLVHSSVEIEAGRSIVRQQDIGNVVHQATRRYPQGPYMPLQVIPQEFQVGTRAGIQNPLGLPAQRLEALVRVISTLDEEHTAATKVVNKAGVQVQETIYAGFAAAYASLSDEERADGVVHLNIGKTCSGLVAYYEGILRLARGIPVGQDHLSKDVAEIFDTDLTVAAALIHEFGTIGQDRVLTNAYVVVPNNRSFGNQRLGQPKRRSTLNKIISARVVECLELARAELWREGLRSDKLKSLVLTGDAAYLPGIKQLSQSILGIRSRIGIPRRIRNLPVQLRHPGWACAVGLVLYAHRMLYRPQQEFNRAIRLSYKTRRETHV